MEYKYDEATMFEMARAVQEGGPWPGVGMESGVGLRNPGMSVWVFVGLARLTGAEDPVALTRAVIWLNVLALLALAAFIRTRVPRGAREQWYWALGLVAVNPMAIQLQRKIWAQSVLPVFSLITLIGWWHRTRAWGAFLWGAMGTLLGQIHMSGFFFFGGVALWTGLFRREGVRWRAWTAGVLVGTLPLVPWLAYVMRAPEEGGGLFWRELFRFRFWGHWTGEVIGFHVGRSLGMRAFWDFLATPVVGGVPTWGVGVLHLILYGAVLAVFARAARALWRRRGEWRALVVGRESESAFLVCAALWGFGALLTLSMKGVARHYLIVAFPLGALWFARLALTKPHAGRRALLIVGATQLIISLAFLGYVHRNGGAPNGDYGVAYSRQVAPPDAP